jgi:hypothetical protein
MPQDPDFDNLMKKAGVRRLNPEGSAAPTQDASRPRTVRRKAGETKAANPTATAPVAAAPVVPDRSAEIAELEARVASLEAALEAEKAARGDDAASAKANLAKLEARYEAYADIAAQVVRSCVNCPSAPGFPAIRVIAEDCEVCGGGDLRTSVRRFIDACLVNGRLKVCVAGHTSKAQALLRAAAQDRRVTLVQADTGEQRSMDQVQGDVKHADAVVLWCADGLKKEVLEAYKAAPRLVVVDEATLPAMLQAAAEVVASD